MESRATIEALRALLPNVMRDDVAWCETRLAGALARLQRKQPVDRILGQVIRRMEDSAERRRQREARRPTPQYDGSLPIHAHREAIVAAIREHPVLILAGETGSGKTTQLPKLCLEAGRGLSGLIGCTQPRRIAARAMAERVAEELQSELGGAVGYQVRFREKVSADGYIKFMTDGILLAETMHDRDLDAYDTLVIDEAHERSLNIDFLLGYLRQLLPRRPDLRLIITSATIDTEKFSRHFGDAPVIEVSGRGYPVDVIYQPLGEEEEAGEGDRRNLYRAIADGVSRLGRIDPRGDILVFLSGEREIREAMHYLERRNLRHTEVLPLYARLSNAEQRRVFHPGPARRVILSTNVAETSLTVPRIRFVIDSGLARISRYAHRSRIQRLPIEPVSQASANQRMGRCGRLGPGTCIRLYAEDDFELRPEFTEPEILRTSLASVILRMLTMNLGAVEDFPFVDAPAPRMISDAYQLLFELGAVDSEREPTALGRRLAGWPLDVRLARMLEEGARLGCLEDLLVLVAGLSIQDPRERPLDAQAAADQAHDRFADPKSDFAALLALWRHLRKERRERTGNQFRTLCRREFLSWQRVLEWFDVYQQLRDQAREERMPLTGGHGDYEQVHRALLSGLLSQLGQRDPEEPVYHGARGRRFHVFPGSGLFGSGPRWLMSAEIVETTRPYARTNAQVEAAWIEQAAAHLLKHTYMDPHWSRSRGEVMADEQVSLFGLVLVERRRLRYAAVDAAGARSIFIHSALAGDDLDDTLGFVRTNRATRATVELLEHKRRARDVLVGEAVLAQFFDQRLPDTVCSVKTLKQWLARSGAAADRSLQFAADLLLRDGAGRAPVELYPDSMEVAGRAFPLRYLFQPGDPGDGVTLEIPLEALNTLDAGRLQWLVPGWLEEKVGALIRTLPKPVRRVLTPAPQYVATTLSDLSAVHGQGLLEAMARSLTRRSPAAVAAGDFDEAALPDHLRMRVVLLDDRGGVLAAGRDLEALKARFGARARRRFMDREGREWNRDGATAWTFGELPLTVTAPGGARAWPALVDQEEAVGLRLFDTAEEAVMAHLEGVLRLLSLELSDKLRYLARQHGLSQGSRLAWAPFGSVTGLVEDLVQSCLYAAAGEAAAAVRDAPAFTALAARVRKEIGRVFQQRAACLEEVLNWLGRIAPGLSGELARRRPTVSEELQEQLHDLLYEGFLLDLEPERLPDYPRYLQAMARRLERLDIDPARDAALMDQVRPWWTRYQQRLAAGAEYEAALDRYRWLIEEYRVSLFAQNLGTREKVSPQRLAEAWEAVTRS